MCTQQLIETARQEHTHTTTTTKSLEHILQLKPQSGCKNTTQQHLQYITAEVRQPTTYHRSPLDVISPPSSTLGEVDACQGAKKE
jgi:hypothetical protein